MSDTTAEPITLEAFNPADLLLDANARTNAEATVTKADVALCKTIAAARTASCGSVPGTAAPSAACVLASPFWGSSPAPRATNEPTGAPG